MHSANKGEWSELYAFVKLLKEGKIYAADEKAEKLDNIWFPILKLIREELEGKKQKKTLEYFSKEKIVVYENNQKVAEIPLEDIAQNTALLFEKINQGGKAAFEIPEIEGFLETLKITRIKAASRKKADLSMQIHDIHTGYEPVVGFSVKSDVGNPPTLLNAGINTNLRFKIRGVSIADMQRINAIDKSVCREYIKQRIIELMKVAKAVEFDRMESDTFADNLMMIDTRMPEIYAALVLLHYYLISDSVTDCEVIADVLAHSNPLGFHRSDIYRYKLKKLLCASALGMTPGEKWDGLDEATGGYIIVKRDGDVVCYHLYNRDYFEEYLLHNTYFDRPSPSRHGFGTIYLENGEMYIKLNVQIRFKSAGKALPATGSTAYQKHVNQVLQVHEGLRVEYSVRK